MKKRKIKVALGLSGGVDSAVSAYLLKKQGFDVSCVYLNCFDSDTPGCRGDQDRKDALAVAMHLGLPFQVLDFRKEYQAAVIDYFKKEYLLGRTPNPDVVCNRDIKFGLFLDWAVKNHYEYVATGHYAKIERNDYDGKDGLDGKDGYRVDNNPNTLNTLNHLLVRPKDLHKDQTYFLWAVPRQKFSRVLFPLGNLLKTEVREIALKIGLSVAKKKDSTGICFVGEVRVEDFLKRLGVKEKKGEVVIRKTRNSKLETRNKSQIRNSKNSKISDFGFRISDLDYDCQVIGSHRGVWFYTIGQRHGFSTDLWSSKMNVERRTLNVDQRTTYNAQRPTFVTDCPPLYVIEKDIKKNRLIVGFGADCYRDNFEVAECNWLAPIYDLPARRRYASGVAGGRFMNYESVLVRIRHCGELIPCQIKMIGDHSLKIENCKLKIKLGAAQRGVAPGQSAVFYSKEGVVLGGGIIQP